MVKAFRRQFAAESFVLILTVGECVGVHYKPSRTTRSLYESRLNYAESVNIWIVYVIQNPRTTEIPPQFNVGTCSCKSAPKLFQKT